MSDRRREMSRRQFIVGGAAGAVASGLAARASAQQQPRTEGNIDSDAVANVARISGLQFTPEECAEVAKTARRYPARFDRLRERAMANGVGPATLFRPLPRTTPAGAAERARVPEDAPALPEREEDIAYAPARWLSSWIHSGSLSSERLTRIYLDRLRRLGPRLECVITLTEELALERARRADAELREGRSRGPLHGIPYGAKDLFDTAGIATTWGAQPYRDRVPQADADVIRRLDEAGAVLVCKTTLGALAMGDVWYGGKTRNPWDLDQGSSGSSAGSAAGTAAGLFGFSIGTETLGSIVSPSMRCGTTGLRPTFGRVSRAGAMALCWSLDKVGPICRCVADTALVLAAIHGEEEGDPASTTRPFGFDPERSVEGLRVGIVRQWFEDRGRRSLAHERSVLRALTELGADVVEVELPEWPYSTLRVILEVEAAAAFDELTRSNRDDELVAQGRGSWPAIFRAARLVPAVELIQAERFRREVCEMMDEVFGGVAAIFGPSFAGPMLLITNFTGHPSLTLRTGFRDGHPTGMTLWGRHYDEETIATIGAALERALGVWNERPSLG